MRPPLRLIEPATRGVSMRDARRGLERGLARHRSGPAPRPAWAWPGRASAARCGAGCPVGAGAPGCGTDVVGCGCVCCCCCCCLLLHLRQAEKDLPSDQHDGRQHDGEQHVLLVVHLIGPCCACRRVAGALALSRRSALLKSSIIVVELPAQGGAPSDQHVVVARAQRCPRPSADDVAQPPAHAIALDRGSDLARHREADPRRTVVVAVAPLQHECRRRNLGPAGCGQEIRPLLQPDHCDARRVGSGAEPLAAAACAGLRPPCGRPWSPCVREIRDGACARACWVDRSASRVLLRLDAGVLADGSPHIAPARCRTAASRPKNAICGGRRHFSSPAAYKGGRPCSSMEQGLRASP